MAGGHVAPCFVLVPQALHGRRSCGSLFVPQHWPMKVEQKDESSKTVRKQFEKAKRSENIPKPPDTVRNHPKRSETVPNRLNPQWNLLSDGVVMGICPKSRYDKKVFAKNRYDKRCFTTKSFSAKPLRQTNSPQAPHGCLLKGPCMLVTVRVGAQPAVVLRRARPMAKCTCDMKPDCGDLLLPMALDT